MRVDAKNRRILVDIPLTDPTGKFRVKSRRFFYEYGVPHAGRQKPFTRENYVEWQISYDVEMKKLREKPRLTTLPDKLFSANNGKTKAFYELSEYLYYFHTWGCVSDAELKDMRRFLCGLGEDDLLSNHGDCKIKRTHPVEKKINDTRFFGMTLEYPQLIYRFEDYEIIVEITIREKQRAIGVQPMLYLCFPITELRTSDNLIGRTAKVKEHGQFLLDEGNHRVLVEMARIFGMLSPSHNRDMIAILEAVAGEAQRAPPP